MSRTTSIHKIYRFHSKPLLGYVAPFKVYMRQQLLLRWWKTARDNNISCSCNTKDKWLLCSDYKAWRKKFMLLHSVWKILARRNHSRLTMRYNNLQSCPLDAEGISAHAGCFLRYSDTSFGADNNIINITPY